MSTLEATTYEVREGLLIDIETGEIVGVVAPDGGELLDKPEQPATFQIDNEDKANWVLGRLLKRDSAISAASVTRDTVTDRIRQRQDEVLAELEKDPSFIEWRAIEANCERIIARNAKEKDGLVARFTYELKEFAQRALAGAKSRTLALPFGTLSLRKKGGGLSIVNPDTFCTWAMERDLYELVKFSPLISKVKGDVEQTFLTDATAREEAGLEMVPEDDTLTISTGVGK